MDQAKKKRNPWIRVARIAAKTILFTILFILLVFLFIQTPPGQNIVRKKVVTWLERKLDTRVEIGTIHFTLPTNIVLKDFYIEDREKDTLLAGKLVNANINIWQAIVNGVTNIESIELENITANLSRESTEKSFNFQFILDAFAPVDTSNVKDSMGSNFTLRSVKLDNIRLRYNDVVSGNDVQAWIQHLDTKIDTFDPVNMHFDIPKTNISGLTARVYQVKPLASPEPAIKDKMEAFEPVMTIINFKELNIENSSLDYRNDVSAIYSNIQVGNIEIQPVDFDLPNRSIHLERLQMENTKGNIRMGKKQAAAVIEKEVKQELESRAEAGWEIRIDNIDFKNNNLAFDNDNSARLYGAMDYAHLKADSFTIKANDLIISKDSIAGNIENASFREQSGFVLDELRTRFLYSNHESSLADLYLKTPYTELKRSAAIRYASIESLASDIANMQIELDLEDSRLLVRDLLFFVPSLKSVPAFAYPHTVWYLNSQASGRLADLQIDALQVQGLNETRIDIAGHIGGLPDLKNVQANLVINNISSSRRDIELFVPRRQLPKNITIPSQFTVQGRMQGHSGLVQTDLDIATSLGFASVNGSFAKIGDPLNASYDTRVQTRGLAIGTIIQNPDLRGPISASFAVKGKGLTKSADARFDGIVHSFRYNQYTYRNLTLRGNISDQVLFTNASMREPNIDFNVEARANLANQYPSLQLTGMIDSIKLRPLNLGTENIIYRGRVNADFAVTNPDALEGTLYLTDNLFVHDAERLLMDTVILVAGTNDMGRYIRLNSDVMNAEIAGQYRLTQLGNIFAQAMQPYFAVKPGRVITNENYDFTFNAHIVDNPALKIFIPDLKEMDSITVRSHFAPGNWTASINAPFVEFGPNKLHNLRINAGTGQSSVLMEASMDQFSSGKNIRLERTTLTASLANNQMNFTLNSKDNRSRDKYVIKGILQQPTSGVYEFALASDSLILNYDAWSVNTNNKIRISPGGIQASNFVLSRGGQQLALNSQSLAGGPLDAKFTNFQLATLTGFIQADSTFANGVMNGSISFIDIARDPVFSGDLTITDFSFKGDTVGNIHAIVNNRVANTYTVDITLSGRGNDARATGNYYFQAGTSRFDLDLDLRSLPLSTLQAFSNDMITGASGTMNGKFDITGTLNQPVVNGDLKFDKAGFNFTMLNSYFTIDGEAVSFTKDGLRFNRFEIKDSAQNSLIINGTAATRNFTNYEFDLDIRAYNFRALNSTKKNNKIFYGRLYFDTNLRLQGTESAPLIDGELTVNDKTMLSVVLPQREPGIVERDGIVEFVDMDAGINDSLFLAAYDSLNVSDFRGMDIAINVEIVKDAEFNLIIDEGNGDFLNVKGEALLTGGIDPSGKIQISGSYEIDQGAYELSFNFLKRRFNIQKGSRIVWDGEPTSATVDVKAVYVANAAPLDLVKSQLEEVSAFERNTYLQKLPFDVQLEMEGQILRPEIKFDIVLPDKSYMVSADIIRNVRTRLDQLRLDQGETNKQVFSLLLLNRFIGENPFNSTGLGPRPAVLARQSVSKLLTEQLNRLAGELIAGVDLNFDVLSSEDYTTGERQDRTDLNVQLSKRLLNDRLTVTIGSNFELEGPSHANTRSSNLAGDVALDYRISRDNRYLLRVYRKNEYQGIIDGYIIETGVSFIITVDYNRFRQLFMSKRERDQRRQRRLQIREAEEQQKIQAAPATGTGPTSN